MRLYSDSRENCHFLNQLFRKVFNKFCWPGETLSIIIHHASRSSNFSQTKTYNTLDHLNCKVTFIQLNKQKTAQYFLQNFQYSTMWIYTFCKICEHKCKHDIVLVLVTKKKNQAPTSIRKSSKHLNNLTNCILIWKNWRKYGSVSYSFSCKISQLFCTYNLFQVKTDFFFIGQTQKKNICYSHYMRFGDSVCTWQ